MGGYLAAGLERNGSAHCGQGGAGVCFAVSDRGPRRSLGVVPVLIRRCGRGIRAAREAIPCRRNLFVYPSSC